MPVAAGASVTPPGPGTTGSARTPARSKRGRWWALGGGVLALLLVAGAAIVIPQIMHAQRVATYNDLVLQTDAATSQAYQLRERADHITVLTALQFDEVREFQLVLKELSGFSDHYFAPGQLDALAKANADLTAALEDDSLPGDEIEVVSRAKATIDTDGYVWQTGFLNLTPDAMEELFERSPAPSMTPVDDDDVSQEVVEQARLALESAEADLIDAETTFEAAENQAQSLLVAVTATLDPLRSSALSAPDQAEVVLNMYPAADAEIVRSLRESARLAAESVSAELFAVDDEYQPVPITGTPAEDTVYFAVNDAWRSTIIATHLMNYSKAITGAWITDAGGVEEALGFNPFLPFG